MGYEKEVLALRPHTKWAGQAIRFYETIDSTSLEVARIAEETPHGTVVVAESQTAGRGRRGRTWESPAGVNLYFSILLKPQLSAEKASMLTLVMAMAVMDGVKHCMDGQAGSHCAEGDEGQACQGMFPCIKWPNDIVMNGKKICGILTEAKLQGSQLEHVVIGVGVNVGKSPLAEELVDKATSLEQECGYVWDRTALLAQILECFESYYEQFVADGSLAGLQERYNAGLVNRDREVRVLDPKGEYTGIARGINELGELLVECADGSVTAVYAGEVSVRGVYGYV